MLFEFLDLQEARSRGVPELAVFTGQLRATLRAGGKRVRPLLCVRGWQAIHDEDPPLALWRAAASLEMFHASALIHDDIMDCSRMRRGQPTAHRALAAAHPSHPNCDSLGGNSALLLGDLALAWSYDLLYAPPASMPDQLALTWPVLNAMRIDTMIGQYLDLAASGRPTGDVSSALRIIRYKTAKYTVEHPLRLGACLGHATREQLLGLVAYALPLGEAFQLRDDLLGVFGNPDETGKPALDDLRQGKHTVLVALALQRATRPQARRLGLLLGDPDLDVQGADEIRNILTASGARAGVEDLIYIRYAQAVSALDSRLLRPRARDALRSIAADVVTRSA
ncbi:polyprenyl synthetase family protein [Streptomyces sp. NPDC096324]|uniref:polyprenyl synthetase family protein n=1 Tax=Streptomyces sp. NPDC096324 TaxID=3366085 RepID=UPI003819D277